jgi:acetyl-CoA carboxylase carboxyltransferase component
VPAERPYGHNTANLVVGLVTHHFGPFPEGLTRVLLLGDPTRAMGSLAEPECRRIIAALDLAEREGYAVEWVAVVQRRAHRHGLGHRKPRLDRPRARPHRAFTQAGGTLNVLVDGVNVGAQSYWNAEATMLLHCRGALIMTPAGSMLLTGKRALEYAGSVAAEDNLGIGGYERVMGPNGEAQYFAPDLTAAYRLLFRHLALTATAPGESRPRACPRATPTTATSPARPTSRTAPRDFVPWARSSTRPPTPGASAPSPSAP